MLLKKASTIASIGGVCCIVFLIVYKLFTKRPQLLDIVFENSVITGKTKTHRLFLCAQSRIAYLFNAKHIYVYLKIRFSLVSYPL